MTVRAMTDEEIERLRDGASDEYPLDETVWSLVLRVEALRAELAQAKEEIAKLEERNKELIDDWLKSSKDARIEKAAQERAEAEVGRLKNTTQCWQTWGVIEIMRRNVNVDSFVRDQEARVRELEGLLTSYVQAGIEAQKTEEEEGGGMTDETKAGSAPAEGVADTDWTDAVMCPHCGKEQYDGWELFLESDAAENHCQHCEQAFLAVRHETVNYSTRKKEESK